MNDLVLEGFVSNYADSRGLSELPTPAVFEAFATSSMLRKYHQTDASGMEDDVLIGGSGDGAMDAIAILVNGRLVSSEQDLDFFVETHGMLDVEFAFIQAKTSAKFNAADMGSFIFGVEQFFKSALNMPQNLSFNDEVQQRIDLTSSIFRQTIKMQNNPKCSLYYVSTGSWTGESEPLGRVKYAKETLDATNLFSQVRVMPVDAELLKSTYRELERSVVKEVEFIRTTTFPKIDGVREAYIGLLAGDEFIKLVSTDEGDLNRSLFYDNVRDFQGYNPVNREIEHTLGNDELRNSFPLLNNGITIIARSIKRTADTLQITDFQIVNGCQTTHVIFHNKNMVGPETFIPVKIVATEDTQVVNEVIKATNRQSAVLPEALESLTPFHRELEDTYRARELRSDPSQRIYYERRSKQYLMEQIPPTNVVTLTAQIKSFIGMFLDEPHSHPRYYGELLKAYEGRIFAPDHRPEPYYASGVSTLLVDQWLNSRSAWRDLRQYRYQILMLLRMSTGGMKMPQINSNAIAAYSLEIVDMLRDRTQGQQVFEDAIGKLIECLDRFGGRTGRPYGIGERNPPHRRREFTQHLKNEYLDPGHARTPETAIEITNTIGSSGRHEKPNERMSGRIKVFDDVKRYGFIENKGDIDMFVHETQMRAVPYHLRVSGIDVTFVVEESPRNPGMLMAGDVQLVPRDEIGKL